MKYSFRSNLLKKYIPFNFNILFGVFLFSFTLLGANLNEIKKSLINDTGLLYPCCSGENIAINGSFEEGSFTANSSVIDVSNAMTSSSFGGVPLDSLILDRYTFWIEDPTRATDGNRFIYLPEAHDQGKCVIREAPLFGESLTPNATYQVTFDIAGFDENNTEVNTNYILEFFYKNADGSQEQEMVQDEFYLECTTTPAPNPIPISNWSSLNWTRVTGEITLPPPNSNAYTEIRMILSANDGGGALIDNICVNKVAEAISITVAKTDPTTNTNGSIALTSVSIGDRYEYNTTGFGNLPLTHNLAINTITGIPQTIVSNVPPPENLETYYIRVYGSDDSFKDTSVVFMPLSSPNYPEAYTCDNTTLLVGDLLPDGGGQTVSFPFEIGNPAPPACSEKLNYGGEGLAYCENNNVVYIARFAPNQIGIWDLATNSLSDSISLTTGTPYDVAMTSDCSYLYVATSGGIERINLITNVTDQTRLLVDLDAVATGDGTPWGVDIHPTTGEVYITFGWGSWWPIFGGGPKESSILKVAADLQGTIIEVVPHEANGLFMGMKFLPNGNFWVSWDGEEPPAFPFPYVHSEEIRLYDALGNLIDNKPIIIGGNQEYFTDPNDITFGPDGNIYVTTYAEYCVVRYLPITDTWEEYLGPDPSGATGKNLEFVCSNVFCVETECDDGVDNDGDGLIDCEDADCTPNLVTNGGFEDIGTATFSTTFEGSPAEPLPRNSTLLSGWYMDYSCLAAPAPCPDGYLIDDSADLVNNPEGDHFVWFAGSGYCARQDFTTELDVCYKISMNVAAWSSPGPQTGTQTTFSVEAFSGGIDDGDGGTLQLFTTNIPESGSWSNLNWQTISFTWRPDIATNTNLFFSQKGGPSSNGLAIDNIRVQKVCCETCGDGIDNDGDGLIDCFDNDCPSCLPQDCTDNVQVMAVREERATGMGSAGTPTISNFYIPEGNNRAILIAAFFEREHCQSGDDCTGTNTAGTGLGDNFASPTILSSRQITARFTGAGDSIDRSNPLFLPNGDLRFGIQVIGATDNYSTTFYSREAYYIAIYEDDINSLLSGASSGNISVTLPDVLGPLDDADEAILLGYVFSNVGQTSSGIVRSGSDISFDPVSGYSGGYTLVDSDLDYLQEPDEPEDGILVIGMNGTQGYGFENISGFTTVTNTSVSNNLGDFNEYNEPDGFSITGQFRNGPISGIIDNVSLQSLAPTSVLLNGGLMTVFTIESCGGIEICGDGVDGDSDGDIDFEDSDCDICATNFTTEKLYISKYGSLTCSDDIIVLDWDATTTTATNEQNLGQDVSGYGWSDIAFAPDGKLYANWTPDNDNMELYDIDPLSGRYVRYICQIDGANPYITQWELVSDIDGYLYTVLGDSTTTALYKYKPSDFNFDSYCDSLTLVVDLTSTGLVGDGDLAWSSGLLYWSATASNNISSPAQLVEIDIQTGTYTIHPLIDGSGNNLFDVDAVVNDSEGNLIIGDENSILYEVDKSNFSVSTAYNLTNNCGAIGGLSTRYEFLQSEPCPEICNDGIDNDGDGLIDCADCEDCTNSTLCNDNDSDGIGDYCDLDDDNDGIPDSEERCRQNDQVAYDRAFPGEDINGDLDVSFSGQLGLTGRIVTSFGSGGNSSNPIYEDATTGLGITSIGGSSATTGAQTTITFNTTVTMEQFIVTSVAKDYSGSYDESQQIRFYDKGNQVEFIPTIVGTNGSPNVYATYNTATGLALGEDPTVAGTGGEAGFHFVIDRGVDSIVVMQNTGATFDNVGIRFFIICSDRDLDDDGVPDYFDLDSDNDGVFDLDEAGHTADDSNDDGIIDGSNSAFGTNGLFNLLETTPDNGIINYTIAVSDGAIDGTYDAVKLDSDGDGCFDTEEADVPDFENNGIAGNGVPSVDSNGLVNAITYTSPTTNNWQDPSLGVCFPEICDDGIDNDLDGLIDSLDPDCISCCDGNNIARNGSFESGSFTTNASVVDPNNAMVASSFGGLPIDDFDTDSGVYWIEDAARATDGNHFIYLPDAATSGKCIYQTESLFSGDLTACATYEVTFDIAGFDEIGTAANTNYILEFFYKNNDGSIEQEMVQENFIIECTSDPAPNPIATSDWNDLNWTRVTGTINLPPPNNPALNRIELLISVNDGGGALLDNVCVNKIAENISVRAQGTDPTCVDDGIIQIFSISSGDRYEYNTTGFDDLPLTYAAATNTIISLPQTVINNIPPSNSTTTYFLRVYESGNCFKDTSIVINGNLICAEICNDGIDNDFDGFTDCDDSDCITSPTISLSENIVCVDEVIAVSSSDLGAGTVYNWNFGTNANPTTASGIGPHNVFYSNCGSSTISLTVQKNRCSITVDSLIAIVDNENPVWNILPQDLIMECLPSINYSDSIALWLSNYGNGIVNDNCNVFKVENNYTGLSTDCGNAESAVVEFTAIDSCGNESIASASIQILDTQGPEISNLSDITVDCEDVPVAVAPNIIDSCDTSLDIVYQEVIVQHPNSSWKFLPTCELLYAINEFVFDDKGTASATDDEMSFALTVIGQNTGTTWNTMINGTPVSGNYYKTYEFGPLLSNGSALSFLVRDSDEAACSVLLEINATDF